MTSITLHVGIGTFAPVRTEEIEDHTMESEWIEISRGNGQAIERTKREGRKGHRRRNHDDPGPRIFRGLGGTDSSRATGSRPFLSVLPIAFRVIDGLITNFHLPKSTLVMLVSAFAGKDLLMKAYGSR